MQRVQAYKFQGNLKMDPAAFAAAGHLMHEDLETQLENQPCNMSVAVSPWTSRRAQRRGTSHRRVKKHRHVEGKPSRPDYLA
jgi:hypothetical protein